VSEFTSLREAVDTLATRAVPPDFGELERRASRRGRRRVALGAAAGAAAVILSVGIAGGALSSGERTHPPVQQPSPTESPSSAEEWTPERTRAEGLPLELLARRSGPSPSGLDAQLYCIGEPITTGSPCDRYHPYDPREDQHWALEVTQRGRSALFDVRGTPAIGDFDEDSILVQDGTEQAVRFRLLQADGTAVRLRLLTGRAPAVPGPDVKLIQNLDVYRSGMFGKDGPGWRPYRVDERAGTLQLLDVPEEIEWWGPNVDEFLWGGNGCRVIWQQPDGGFDTHDTGCRKPDGHTDPGWNWDDGYADWLEPGRMALVEWNNSGAPLAVHASLDRGATWERVDIEDRVWDDTTEQISDALVDALRQLD
jgi:hypothetical protein